MGGVASPDALPFTAQAPSLQPRRLLLFGIVLLLLALDVRVAAVILGSQPLGLDWAPLWAAARVPVSGAKAVYDFAAITHAQAPLIGDGAGLRPFVYPPSALLLFLPFAALPFLPAFLLWTMATGAVALAATARFTPRWWLLPLFPPVLLAGLVGQTALLIGGLIATALPLLARRPVLAGLILGVATAIKPQILLLAPVALVLAGRWRALGGWAAGGGVLVVLATALYGPGLWLDWFAALPRFQALVERSPTLIDDAITPYALAHRHGLAGWWIPAAAAIPALATIWLTFRRPAPGADRLIALIGGALLLSPYALHYELALIAPALIARADRGIAPAALLVGVGLSLLLGLGLAGPAAAMVAVAWRHCAARVAEAALPGHPSAAPATRHGFVIAADA